MKRPRCYAWCHVDRWRGDPHGRPQLQRALRPIVAALTILIMVGGCGFPQPAVAPAKCRFPPETTLAFHGRASLRALDLDLLGPVEYHDDVGTVYISEKPIVIPGLLPGDRAARMFCMLGPRGNRTTVGSIPDDWELPASMSP